MPVKKEIKKTERAKSTVTIPKLQALHKSGKEIKPDINTAEPASPVPIQPFTLESLKAVWMEYAEQRKLYKAEFQLLNQEIELNDFTVILHLMNPVHAGQPIQVAKSDVPRQLNKKVVIGTDDQAGIKSHASALSGSSAEHGANGRRDDAGA